MARRGAGPGRPWDVDPDKKKKLLDAIRAGNFRSAACGYAGIQYRTFQKWLAKGRAQPGSKYGAFLREILEAEKSAEVEAVALVKAASRKNWKAAAWWLSTRFDRWKKTDRLEHTGAGGKPIEVLHGLSDKALDELDAVLSGRARGVDRSEFEPGPGGEGEESEG
mgnify:CR=1 FL=1